MKDPETEVLKTLAEQAVATFDGVVSGAPFAEAHRLAAAAVRELTDTSKAALFQRFVRTTADTIQVFEFHAEAFETSRYTDRLAGLHAACREAAPELAAFIRSQVVVDRVYVAAEVSRQSPAEAVATYQRTIAGQLIGVPEFEPHATILAVDGPSLAARVAACLATHETFVAGELKRIADEKLAGEKAVADAEAAQRVDLAAYFFRHHGRAFVVRGHLFRGAILADAARRLGTRNQEGDFVTFELAELMAVRDRELAADAAGQVGGVQ